MPLSQLGTHGYVLDILLYIREKKGSYAAQIINESMPLRSKPTVYMSLRRLEAMGLVYPEIQDQDGTGGLRKMFYLTPLGEEVAGKLAEVEELLKDHHKKSPKNRT